MHESHPQAERFLEKLKCFALFAELFDYYMCKQDVLQSRLAERVFVEPATISHWRKNRRLPENLAILHQVTLALNLSLLERENLVIAWCHTRAVRDLVPFIEEAMRTGDAEYALQVARLVIGGDPSDLLTAEVRQ